MRTGAAVIVQRGDFVIAGRLRSTQEPDSVRFANELLAGEPENFTDVGFGFCA